MKKYNKIRITLLSLLAFLVVSVNLIQAQEFKLNNQESFLTVLGTSSLHDWHIIAEQQKGLINFTNIETCQINKLSITVEVESLKSGKSSMDKNTYKALNTSANKTITFQLQEVKNVVNKGQNTFLINTLGDLTIAGTKQRVSLDFTVSIIDSKVKVSGEKKIKMTDFNVDPPKALFGTITTGNDITIKFSTIFK
jgi:polyisoprenoid-binding protein YceI